MLVGYARVSTSDQTDSLQIDALKAAGCERIYRETVSGAKADRPELANALTFLRPRDTLVVWKLDRLARSMRQLIDTVEELQKREIGFRSLTQAIDTTTAGGKFVFNVFGALAEFERDLIRERTNAGLSAARARGRQGGRPPALNDSTKATILLSLTHTDQSFSELAKQFKTSEATLRRYFPGGREQYRVRPAA
ncbi:recombinase family protein [Microvirga sp. 2TAF3]|uniref:recombinase family protein n=1 Tax=Microvirga sp. 2TAF3 TaxID=3233014 RepID=UPI003F97FD18